MDVGTIEGYQGEEKSVVILCMVRSEKLGFMAFPPRLLTGVSRAADALAIITNDAGIRGGEQKRKRFCYDHIRSLFMESGAHVTSTEDLPALDHLQHDYNSDQDDGNQGDNDLESGEQHEVTPSTTENTAGGNGGNGTDVAGWGYQVGPGDQGEQSWN